MINNVDNLSSSASGRAGDDDTDLVEACQASTGQMNQPSDHNSQQQQQQQQQPKSHNRHHSSSCSSLTSGLGQSDHSICNDVRLASPTQPPANAAQPTTELDHYEHFVPTSMSANNFIESKSVDPKLKSDIKKFVDNIFTDSESISLEKKAEFGQLVRLPEARLLFAMFVDDYRVNRKRVSELTFYSLAQYFSIVLLECLLAEDFRPAKIIMNMMFTYYYEQNCDKIPPRDRQPLLDQGLDYRRDTIGCYDAASNGVSSSSASCENSDTDAMRKTTIVKTYLYNLLKDQQIFKSIRFWTSAFYESVIIERNNHSVFVDREQGKLSNEKRNEELDCSKNITFGLLGSFIYNMSLLDLSNEFCQEFLDKHSTIAGLSDEQLDILRSNMKTMFSETNATRTTTTSPASTSEKFATFIQKLSNRLNHQVTLRGEPKSLN